MTYKMPHYLSITGCDVRSFTDKLRVKHPIVKNIAGEWVLLAHHNVMAAALDNERFSSNVSRYLQVPNGLDGEEHSQYRKIIERFLTRLAITPFIPVFEDVANKLVAELPKGQILDAVNDIGAVFAVRAQCAWLGWPTELEPLLLAWMKENHAATRSGNHEWTVSIAEKFDDIVSTIIQSRRANHSNSPDDITGQLCRETINGRLLTEKELVSILRNWTGGDLGSIALCVGVIVAYIAENPSLITTIQQVSDLEVEAIINEILRIDNPFVSDPIAHADNNLLYGIGKHVCPGRLLASWQLRIALQTLLASVEKISLVQEQLPEREIAPVGGYHRVPVIFT